MGWSTELVLIMGSSPPCSIIVPIITTMSKWDPQFRRVAIRNGGQVFKAPQNNRGLAGYHTAKSHYAIAGKSPKSQVDAQVKDFEKSLVEKLNGKDYLKYLWNKVKNKYLRL